MNAGRAPRPLGRLSLVIPFAVMAATVLLVAPAPARAGVASNQLCGMAGLGAGCIGTFRPSATTIRPSVGGMGVVRPNVGGMMGGIMGTVMGMVAEQVLDQMLESAMESQGAPAPETPDFSNAVESAVEKQMRLQLDRDQQALAAMADVAANQLADNPANMDFLESQSYQSSLGFDRPLDSAGDALWMRIQDPWYSPESGGEAGAGGRPLALGNSRLQYSVRDTDRLQCITSLGGELCGFPGMNNAALTLKPIPLQPSPPPLGAPPPVPVAGGTPQLLRTETVVAPVISTLPLQAPAAPEPPCSAAVAFEAPESLMAVARSEDPQGAGGAYILNLTVDKLHGQLGELQGNVASIVTDTYREFTQRLLCKTLALLAAAPRSIALGQGDAAAQADEIQAKAEGLLFQIGMDKYLDKVKGFLEEKVDKVQEELQTDAEDAAKDAVLRRPGPPLDRDIGPYSKEGVEATALRYREPWNVEARVQHWMKNSPHDHLLPGTEGRDAGALKE